ncbi:Oligoxyloglucan reducing end-specific cellobiohydrolase [Pleurotus eryngii]|uniref:Oligoxyloglucan reducing end-specific cellobiohydrolase n=1 Tax=Pleurotus eryngii TaxID=5323 RepID=A0A9P6DHL0_PLEER|nr:Oligoxyloglucan reducing end-specific cellobiohydrolase [Pleurotus eryngii]
MRASFLLAVAVATFSQLACTVNSQAYSWKNISNGGGFISSIGFTYAQIDIGGLLLDSVDSNNWNHWGIDMLATDPVNPKHFYLAVGMYMNSWDPNNGAILISKDYQIAVDPHSNNILYCSTHSRNGLYKSVNFGCQILACLGFSSNVLLSGTFILDPNDIYKYNNIIIGFSWITFDSTTGTNGYSTPHIFVSENARTVIMCQDMTFLPHKGVLSPSENTLYITYSDRAGLYGSTISPPLPARTNITPVSGGDLYFGFGSLGVDLQVLGTIMVAALNSCWSGYPNLQKHFSYDNSGIPWTGPNYLNTNTGTLQISWMMEALVIDPFNSNHWLYRTGATMYGGFDLKKWDTIHNTLVHGLISPPTRANLLSGVANAMVNLNYTGNQPTNIICVGAGDEETKQVVISSNSGASWYKFIHYGAPDSVHGGEVALSANADMILWHTEGNGVMVSQHQSTFTAVTLLPLDTAIASDKKTNTVFYAASSSTLYISTNLDQTFTSQGTLGSSMTAWSIVFGAPASTGGYPALFAAADFQNKGYFRSDDAGINWAKNLWKIWSYFMKQVYPDTNECGIFYGDATETQSPNTATVTPTSSVPSIMSNPPFTSNPPVTSNLPVTSNPPSMTSSVLPSTPTVGPWGQCRGQGYTGPTISAAGSTCIINNPCTFKGNEGSEDIWAWLQLLAAPPTLLCALYFKDESYVGTEGMGRGEGREMWTSVKR